MGNRRSIGARALAPEGAIYYAEDVREQFWYRGEKVRVVKRTRSGNKNGNLQIAVEEYTVVQTCRDFVVVNNGLYNFCIHKTDILFGEEVDEKV